MGNLIPLAQNAAFTERIPSFQKPASLCATGKNSTSLLNSWGRPPVLGELDGWSFTDSLPPLNQRYRFLINPRIHFASLATVFYPLLSNPPPGGKTKSANQKHAGKIILICPLSLAPLLVSSFFLSETSNDPSNRPSPYVPYLEKERKNPINQTTKHEPCDSHLACFLFSPSFWAVSRGEIGHRWF